MAFLIDEAIVCDDCADTVLTVKAGVLGRDADPVPVRRVEDDKLPASCSRCKTEIPAPDRRSANVRMAELVSRLPSLARLPFATKWDDKSPELLDDYITGGAGTSGSRAAVQFVLAVWSGENRPAQYAPEWDDVLDGAQCFHPPGMLVMRLGRHTGTVRCGKCQDEWTMPRTIARAVARALSAECGWRVGPFDLLRALAVWDAAHVKALLGYLKSPFRP